MIKATLNNNTGTTNIRKCHCAKCGTTLEKNQGVKVYSRNTYQFLCDACSVAMQGDYSTENSVIMNNQTKTNACTISIELEVPYAALDFNYRSGFQWLTQDANFIKTNDCTVWAEFKSPIYNNMIGLSKALNNFEKLNKLSEWHNDINYGTHLNIGNLILTYRELNIIERFYHSLFVPYCKYLEENVTKTTAIHGRYFSEWALPINYNTDTQRHKNFVNMEHSTHIEFRLCKLTSARQYMLCARMYQDIVQKVLCDYFLAKYNEDMTANQKKALAKTASQKMIKVFDKYYNKLING